MNSGFFQEDTGAKSSARLIFAIGMVWAMAITTVMSIVMEWSPGELIAVFTSTSAVFVGLKLGQKPMEGKNKTDVK